MLDNVKKQVNEIVDAVTKLFTAIIDQDIPELMLEKISGAQMGSEPQDLVKKTAETRFKKLMLKLEDISSPFSNINWGKTVAKKELEISFFTLSKGTEVEPLARRRFLVRDIAEMHLMLLSALAYNHHSRHIQGFYSSGPAYFTK